MTSANLALHNHASIYVLEEIISLAFGVNVASEVPPPRASCFKDNIVCLNWKYRKNTMFAKPYVFE
jgi:hypothetical protein